MGRQRLEKVLPRSRGRPIPTRCGATATGLPLQVLGHPLGADQSRDNASDDCLATWEQIGGWAQPALFVACVDDE